MLHEVELVQAHYLEAGDCGEFIINDITRIETDSTLKRHWTIAY